MATAGRELFDPVAVDRRVRMAKVGKAVASEEAEP